MKKRGTFLAGIGLVILAGCRSDPQMETRLIVIPPPAVTGSQLYYTFDKNFTDYFGPEGTAAMEKALRAAHPNDEIHVDVLEQRGEPNAP